jgi:hypothetical protein
MPIEFRVRTEDLKRVARQLEATRGQFKTTDVADLVVSTSVLELTAVGTETAIAIDGKVTGSARLPMLMLVKMAETARTYHQKEVSVTVDNGFTRINRTTTRHPEITLNSAVTTPPSMPADASALDTLAIASMMNPEQTADAGLRERVEAAQRKASAAIATAAAALKDFNVSRTELTDLIDQKVSEAAEMIKRVSRGQK